MFLKTIKSKINEIDNYHSLQELQQSMLVLICYYSCDCFTVTLATGIRAGSLLLSSTII